MLIQQILALRELRNDIASEGKSRHSNNRPIGRLAGKTGGILVAIWDLSPSTSD